MSYLFSGRSPVKDVVEAFTSNAGGDLTQGRWLAAKELANCFQANKLDVMRDFSVREMFDALVGPVDLNGDVHTIAEAIASSAFPYITQHVLAPGNIASYSSGLAGADELVTELPGTAQVDDVPVPGFTDVDSLDRVDEGMAYGETHIGEKYVLIKMYKFGKIARLTREAIAYDQTGNLVSHVRTLSEKMGSIRHTLILQKLTAVACTATYGGNTTGEAATRCFRYGGTASTVYSTDHSAIDGQTNSNLDTTAFATSPAIPGDALNATVQLLKKMKGEKGDYVNVPITHLIVPVALWKAGLEAFAGPWQSGSANLTTNVLPQMLGSAPKVFMSPVLDASSTVCYYIGAPAKQLYWVWTFPFKTETAAFTELAFTNDVVFGVKVSWKGNCGHTDYRYIAKGGS